MLWTLCLIAGIFFLGMIIGAGWNSNFVERQRVNRWLEDHDELSRLDRMAQNSRKARDLRGYTGWTDEIGPSYLDRWDRPGHRKYTDEA